jgi:hypothetical protein
LPQEQRPGKWHTGDANNNAYELKYFFQISGHTKQVAGAKKIVSCIADTRKKYGPWRPWIKWERD